MNLKRIAYNLALSSATVLLAGAVAFAQQMPSGSSQQPSMPGQQPQQPQQPTTSNGAPGAYPGTAPTGTTEFGEKAFVSKAMEGDQAEEQLGQLAEQKSQSNDVKQLAQKLVADHTQMDEKWMKPLCQELGLSGSKNPSKKEKKTMAKLEGLSGSDFDSQYLTMMYKDHQKDLKDFKDEANSTQDPNVKQVAEQGANVIQQHLQLIEQVARNHNISLDEKSKQTPSM